MIHQVPADLVSEFWSAIEGYAARVCRYHPFMQARDLLSLFLAGDARLFIVVEANRVVGFAGVEVVAYPRRKVANVLACGGEHGFLSVAVNELLPTLKQWGREQGADTFSITGRPGWVRVLRSHGFEEAAHVTLWANLNVEGRFQEPDANYDFGTVGGSTALSH